MKLPVRAAELAFIRKAKPASPLLAHHVLPIASSAARGGKVWIGIAAALAAGGGDRGRRAAAEGLVSMAPRPHSCTVH